MTSHAGLAPAVAALWACASLIAVCVLFFSLLLIRQLARGKALRRASTRSEAVRPALREALFRILAGSPDESEIRRHLENHREDVAETLLSFHGTVSGGARDRLCRLALDLGLVHEWCHDGGSRDLIRRRSAMGRLAFVCAYEPCRRAIGDLLTRSLNDSDEEIRLASARGLVLSQAATDLEDVFLMALGPNRFARAVLAEDLRRQSAALCADVVPEVLKSGQAEYVKATLEMLAAWDRAVPLDELQPLIEHADRDIRIAALRLAPLCALNQDSRAAIVRAAAASGDSESSSLAGIAAERLNIRLKEKQ